MKTYQVEKRTRWICPEGGGAPLLTMPNIPRPIQGCLEPETKVLTPKGWIEIQHVKEGDIIMCWANGALFFDRVNATVDNYYEYAYRIGYNKKKNFDILYSPDHRLPIECTSYSWGKDGRYKYETPHRKLHVYTAEEFTPKTSRSFYTAGAGTGVEHDLSTEERIYIAIQADGAFKYIKQETGEFVYSLNVKKERKKQRMRMLLEKSKFFWTENNHGKDGYSRFNIWCDKESKLFSSVFSYSMGEKKAKEFIEELCLWDGYIGVRKVFKNEVVSRSYCSTNYENIEFVQAIAAQAGFTSNTRKDTRGEKDPRRSDCWTVEFVENPRRTCGYMKKEKVKVDHRMYCVSVNSTFFLAKYHDRVVITGNCGCQPRTIFGASSWDRMRKRTYYLANYKSEISGVDLSDKGRPQSHELFEIDYSTGTSTFKRCVCISPLEHLCFIHNGRAITLYKQGNPLYPASKLLEGAEHGFKLIYDWNKAHPKKPKLKCYHTFLEYLKHEELSDKMEELIDKYEIEFWAEDTKQMAKWEDWKVVIGDKTYPTPYADYQAWEEAMRKQNENDTARRVTNPFSDSVFDELIKAIQL